MSDKKSLQQSIAREETLLSRLDKVREQALSRIQDYKRDLASLEAACSESQASYPFRSSQEKVALFRSLFHGRNLRFEHSPHLIGGLRVFPHTPDIQSFVQAGETAGR